jgi:hypothetical protein
MSFCVTNNFFRRTPNREAMLNLSRNKGYPPSIEELSRTNDFGRYRNDIQYYHLYYILLTIRNYLRVLTEAATQRNRVFNTLLHILSEKPDFDSAESTMKVLKFYIYLQNFLLVYRKIWDTNRCLHFR